MQVKGAQEHGAAGILIFSDPKDDGAVTVENGYEPYVISHYYHALCSPVTQVS